jgi:hypothetical protein
LAKFRPTGLTGPLRYFSVKRSVASAITIVLLVTLSLDATVDAGDAIIRVPSNGKGDHQVTTVSSAAGDEKKQQLWWCEHPVCDPASDYCLCPYSHVRTMEKSGAKNKSLVHDSSAAPPCEHPFCIFYQGRTGMQVLRRSTSSVQMRIYRCMERAGSVLRALSSSSWLAFTTGIPAFAECRMLCLVPNVGYSAKRSFAKCKAWNTRRKNALGKEVLCRVPTTGHSAKRSFSPSAAQNL